MHSAHISSRIMHCAFCVVLSLSAFAATDDWAQHAHYAEANRLLEQPPVAVFMGNSITEMWNEAHPDFFLAHNYACRGIGGQVSAQMLARFQADVIRLQPQVVVIMAGTNDIGLNNGYISPEHILENIQSMCELAQLHHIQPLLCSVLPVYEYPWRKELVEPSQTILRLNSLFKAYAEQNSIPYIDYYSAMVDDRGGLPAVYSADGVHPISAGYDLMESIIVPAISKYLK